MAVCLELGEFIPAWIAAFCAGDVDAAADLYEEDALFAPPGEAVVQGKTAIRAWFAASFPMLEVLGVQLRSSNQTVVGDYALSSLAAQFTMRPRKNGAESFVVDAFSTEVLHRGADGGWRYHINLGSAQPPATT